MVIGLDFDGVMNCMLETWLEWLNTRHGLAVKFKDVKNWELEKCYTTLTKDELYAPLHFADFWSEVKIQENAPEVIERLIQEGHQVYVITSTHYDILSAKFKNCLLKHFPFIKKENIIITYNKSLINCDLLLDDAEHNLVNFHGIKVIFDAPYNKNASIADFRVTSWEDFYELISELKIAIPDTV